MNIQGKISELDRASHSNSASSDTGESSVSSTAISAANSAGRLPIASDSTTTVNFTVSGEVEGTISQDGPKPNTPLVLYDELGLCAGDEAGRYLLLAPLGAGGMGVVFSAFDPDLNRKVALKFIRVGSEDSLFASQSRALTRSQLLQEAQFMAQLSHPNVVAIYDVGEIRSHVYLAMEIIEGQTLKAWIRGGGYRWPQAVKLLAQAGRGLASAHDAGMVHRDFKPDNVLLGEGNKVCVADFGLVYQGQRPCASTFDEMVVGSNSQLSASTITKQVLGTPSYMSPEQHRGDLATNLSDQFSFCVCLYEAVYGVRPFLGRNLGEIARAIEDGHLTQPSDGHRVPRWLHHIILRGLSHNPEDRYPSMNALLAELELDRGAVRRRIFGGIAASLLALSSLLSHEALSSPPDQECKAGLSKGDKLWDHQTRSEIQPVFRNSGLGFAGSTWTHLDSVFSERSEQWRDAYTEICKVSKTPHLQIDRDLKISCLLRQAEQMQVLVDLLRKADDTTIEGSLNSAKALPPIQDCLHSETLRDRAELPSDPVLRQRVVALRSEQRRILMIRSIGKLASARDLAVDLAVRAEKLGFAPLLSEIYYATGLIYSDIGDDKEAAAWLESALRYAEMGSNEELTAEILNAEIFTFGYRLQQVEGIESRIDHAEAHIQRAGNSPLLRAQWLSMQGAANGGGGRLKQSEVLLREAVDIYERELGPENPETLRAYGNLGYTLQSIGDFDEAETTYRKVIAIAKASMGPIHPALILPTANLIETLCITGQYAKAIELTGQMNEIYEAARGVNTLLSIPAYVRQAQVLFDAGFYSRSAGAWERVRRIHEASNKQNPMLSTIYAALIQTYLRLGDMVEASLLEKEIDLSKGGPQDGRYWIFPFVATIELAIAREDIPRAQSVFLDLAEKGGDILGLDLDRFGKISRLAGDLEMAQGQFEFARRHYSRAFERAKTVYPGESNVNRFPYREALARAEAAIEDDGPD